MPPRASVTAAIYGVMLCALMVALARLGLRPADGLGRSEPAVLVSTTLVVLALACYSGYALMLDGPRRAYNADLAIVSVALLLAGPVPALVVLVIPDVLRIYRRPAFARSLSLLVNVVSYCAAVVAGEWVLSKLPTASVPGRTLALVCADLAIVGVNYLFARLLSEVMRSGADPIALLRSELLTTLPIELVMLLEAVVCVLLVPVAGVIALAPFALTVALPQLALGGLLRNRSVARLEVKRAARVYRAALVDELRLTRPTGRAIEQAAGLLRGDPVAPSSDTQTRQAFGYAFEVRACLERPPAQPAYRAQLPTQVLLISERWAQLTAQDTRALAHLEALAEIAVTTLIADAPEAFGAACRLAQRETALTDHSSTVPRLHTLPLPRGLRDQRLVTAVGRLRTQAG